MGQGDAYTIAAPLRISAEIDPAALERSLGEVVRRHDALRTIFREVDGVPLQAVAPFAGFVLPVEEVPGGDEAEARRRLAEEVARPFDLAAPPRRQPMQRPLRRQGKSPLGGAVTRPRLRKTPQGVRGCPGSHAAERRSTEGRGRTGH